MLWFDAALLFFNTLINDVAKSTSDDSYEVSKKVVFFVSSLINFISMVYIFFNFVF